MMESFEQLLRKKRNIVKCSTYVVITWIGVFCLYQTSHTLKNVNNGKYQNNFISSKTTIKSRAKSSNETLGNWSAKYNEYVDDYDIEHLWVGELSSEIEASIQLQQYLGLRKYKIHLVISHCDKPINWIRESYVPEDVEIESVHIYSKCGNDVEGAQEGDVIIKLPNHGRCDHSNAHHLANLDYANYADDDIIVFMKDNDYRLGFGRPWETMIRMVIFNGFSCVEQTLSFFKYSYSYYHEYKTLAKFTKSFYSREIDRDKADQFQSDYKNLGDFVNKLQLRLNQPLTPVCFGGIFAATISRVKKQKSGWRRIEKALERGDNIEEGHFVERLWAGLLSKPLSPFAIQKLREKTHEIACKNSKEFHKLYGPNEDIFWADRCGALIQKFCKHCTMPFTDMTHDYVYYTDDDETTSADDPLEYIYREMFPLYADRRKIFRDSEDMSTSTDIF